MNIRNISYFIEVAKEKNFTKAARNLHLSQPALSKVIKNIELNLGVYLIDRTSKTFKLTEQGEIFYENSRKAIKNINGELQKLYSSINSTKGRIVVGIPPVISSVYFTSIIANFKSEYPEIEFIMIEEGANSVRDKVLKGDLDLGIIMMPYEHEELETIEVINSEIVLIVNKDSYLARNNSISIKDLKEETFISLNKNYKLYNKLIKLSEEAGFSPKIAYESSQWDFVAEMVSLNQGVALLPKPLVDKYKIDNIKYLKLEDPSIPWDIGILIKKDRYLSFVIKEFILFVKDEAKRLTE